MLHWTNIDGWFDQNDYDTYKHFANKLPQSFTMLEIGAYKGRSTNAMVHICKELGKNVTIDVIDTFAGGEHIGNINTYDDFCKNTARISSRIGNVFVSDSKEAYMILPPNTTYDLIYVDGAHDFESVLCDVENYKQFVSKGGIFAGHDYYHFEVAKALKHSSLKQVEVLHNSWVSYM